MRTGFLCLSAVLLLSCGKADRATGTSSIASEPSQGLSSSTPDKQIEASRPLPNDARRMAKASSACMVQDGGPIHTMPIRAVGTEPFWSARINGRCVQYSHMEDPKGTRVWARHSRNEAGEFWLGTLNGKVFQLSLRNETTCSDGMSDKLYPFSVELSIGTELRKGCAEPN